MLISSSDKVVNAYWDRGMTSLHYKICFWRVCPEGVHTSFEYRSSRE
jgi:hypothetical protein